MSALEPGGATPPVPPARPVRRSPTAPVAAGVATGVLAATTAAATRGVSAAEERVFEVVADVGAPLERLLWLPMQAGAAPASFVAAALAAWRWRRWRPSIGCLVAGLSAWCGAKLVKEVVHRGRPAAELHQFVPLDTAPTDGLGFPSGHAAVAFALAAVVAPYLGRRGRVAAYALATTVAFARVAIGAHLPLDVAGGAALGTALGAGWHVAVGIDDAPDAS